MFTRVCDHGCKIYSCSYNLNDVWGGYNDTRIPSRRWGGRQIKSSNQPNEWSHFRRQFKRQPSDVTSSIYGSLHRMRSHIENYFATNDDKVTRTSYKTTINKNKQCFKWILYFSLFMLIPVDDHPERWCRCRNMMTSSNGNLFRVIGDLCGEFAGPRSDAEIWCFLWSASE